MYLSSVTFFLKSSMIVFISAILVAFFAAKSLAAANFLSNSILTSAAFCFIIPSITRPAISESFRPSFISLDSFTDLICLSISAHCSSNDLSNWSEILFKAASSSALLMLSVVVLRSLSNIAVIFAFNSSLLSPFLKSSDRDLNGACIPVKKFLKAPVAALNIFPKRPKISSFT